MIIRIKQYLKYIYKSIPDYYRFNSIYRKKYNELCESENMNKKEIERHQLKELKKLIKHSYETVPYYKRVFDEINLKPEDIKEIRDIEKIPFLTKDIIRENFDDLISQKYKNNKNLRIVTTGGTTGMPMSLLVDNKFDRNNEWAYISYIWSGLGYNVKKLNRAVILRGNRPKGKSIYEYLGRDLVLSGYDLKKENVKEYIQKIEEFNPDYMRIYPSFGYELASLIKKNNLSLKNVKIKYIISSSENLYDFQIKLIEEVFNAPVYTFYGHTEHCALAIQCREERRYHFIPQYGYTELIREDGKNCLDNELGEIVCTGFNNFAMPLIRYKTQDMGIAYKKQCECFSNYFTVKSIEGRKQEFFIDKNNNKISYIYHDVPIWPVKDKVNAYQYVQNEIGKIELNLMAERPLTLEDEKNVINEFYRYYENFTIKIIYKESIERTKSGKFRYLVQNIK